MEMNVKPIKIITCSICDCNVEKQAVDYDGHIIYIDPKTEQVWKKNVCPECVAIWNTLDDPNKKLTQRKCDMCSCFLPSSRYYNCENCEPNLPNINEDFMYENSPDMDIDEEFFETINPMNLGDYEWNESE